MLDYSKIDAILTENSEISWEEFKKVCGEKKIQCSNWCFNSRKKRLKGLPGYKNMPPIVSSQAPFNTKAFVEKFIPNSNRKKEYEALVSVILKNPKVTYSELAAKKVVAFSDANFYQLRRAVTKALQSKTLDSLKNTETVKRPYVRKATTGMFINIFEKELNGKGLGQEAKSLLEEFIAVLNQEKIANLEIVETISPKRALEIRSFAKI